jgi:Sec7-like guanine-nucleotide exchange factor
LGEDGPGKELNRVCRAQYIEEFDWTGPDVGFFDALKALLTGFRIPGEGQ